ARDRFRAVWDRLEVTGAKSSFHIANNGERIFFARIIRSDDAVVGVLIGNATHQRSLSFVAVAARAENENEPARGQLAQGFQDIEQRVVGVGVIDENLKL